MLDNKYSIKEQLHKANIPRCIRTLLKNKVLQQLNIYPVLWDRITSRKIGKVADIPIWEKKVRAVINQEMSKLTGKTFDIETDMYDE